MKVEEIKNKEGKIIKFYTPENEEDVKLLKKLENEGMVSSKASFGDWKSNKPNKKK